MLKSSKFLTLTQNRGDQNSMKIYDFNGKKNITGTRIKEARKKLGLTQEELAARLQTRGVVIERDSISRIEIGTRFVADYELLALCDALGVSADHLLGII